MVKHAPSMATTLDSITQGASLFLDPTGSQIGESIQGEEGIVYADLDLDQCVEPKQFHDVVGYYQRYDVFDLKVNRRRLGPENVFESEKGIGDEPQAVNRDDMARGGDGPVVENLRGSMRIL